MISNRKTLSSFKSHYRLSEDDIYDGAELVCVYYADRYTTGRPHKLTIGQTYTLHQSYKRRHRDSYDDMESDALTEKLEESMEKIFFDSFRFTLDTGEEFRADKEEFLGCSYDNGNTWLEFVAPNRFTEEELFMLKLSGDIEGMLPPRQSK